MLRRFCWVWDFFIRISAAGTRPGVSPRAVVRRRAPWFVATRRGSSPRAVVRRRVPWFVATRRGAWLTPLKRTHLVGYN